MFQNKNIVSTENTDFCITVLNFIDAYAMKDFIE